MFRQLRRGEGDLGVYAPWRKGRAPNPNPRRDNARDYVVGFTGGGLAPMEWRNVKDTFRKRDRTTGLRETLPREARYVLEFSVSTVPVGGSLPMLAAGLAGLALIGRTAAKRRRTT